MGMLTKHPEYADLQGVSIPPIPLEIRQNVEENLERFLIEGGFPEVWTLPDWETKQSYLFDNQVEKVILEDLVLAVELSKPEMLKRFYISLLENPGREINFQQISKTLGINRASIEKYFPLLEMTDLIRHVEKFTKSQIRVRKGNVNINYLREKDSEVDFIVYLGASNYMPIEVKYKEQVQDIELRTIKNFCKSLNCSTGIVVTKKWDAFGKKEYLIYMPLPHFLLLFD